MLRGKWILENLLNAPPPEPPADVPNLDETESGRRRRSGCSSRSTARTRSAPPATSGWIRSASGSRILMPWGLADNGRQAADRLGGRPPDGRKFSGPTNCGRSCQPTAMPSLRALDVEAPHLCTRTRAGALRHEDRQSIASRLPASDYRFSALVLEIVKSLPSQSRRPSRETETPDQEGQLAMLITRKTAARRTFLRAWAPPSRPDAGRDDPGAGGVRTRRRRRRCVSPSPTCRTASPWPIGRRRATAPPSSSPA